MGNSLKGSVAYERKLASQRAKYVPKPRANRKRTLQRVSRGAIPVVGLALVTRPSNRKDGAVFHYVVAKGRGKLRRFCIEHLGYTEAFRRALAVRAAIEKGALA